MPEVRQGETYMEGLRTAHKNAGTYVDDANMFTNPAYYEAYQNGKYIDWVDELLHTGTVQNYSLSVSGGTKNTKAYMSMNFSDETDKYNDDNYKLYSTIFASITQSINGLLQELVFRHLMCIRISLLQRFKMV